MVYIQFPRGYRASEKLTDTQKKIAIISEVVDYLNTDEELLKKKDRKIELVYARKLVFYFVKKHTRFNDNYIGGIFNRHRTTVIHALNDLQDLIDTDDIVRNDIAFLEKRITA